MRYQSPVANPLAHYWEEEFIGFWGQWLRFRAGSQRLLYYFLGELVFANIYLLLESIANHTVISAGHSIIVRVKYKLHPSVMVKRALDIAGSLVGLVISLPFWLIIPALIKLDSPGPIFYTQVRVGRNRRRASRRHVAVEAPQKRGRGDRRQESGFGKPFRIIKFRTMKLDAESQSGPVWATKSDPRITRIGRILRKTRIDEIPQLLNVLTGEMSIVGPRPERPYFVARLDGVVENYLERFNVKPGVTGLAQVEHKYDESIDDVSRKTRYDLRYIRSWSVIQDIKIMLKTVIVVISARGM